MVIVTIQGTSIMNLSFPIFVILTNLQGADFRILEIN